MIITKKALPRRTFLRGVGGDAGAAAARCDGSVADGAGGDGRPTPCARLGFVYMPMGCDITRWTPPGGRHARRTVADAQLAGAGRGAGHRDHQPGAAERVSGDACDVERRVPERGEGEADGKHRLLSRHDGRSDRRPADRPARRSCRRWSCRWTCCRRSASATTAMPASIRTTCRGRRRRRRCRPKRIRGSCSKACSAKAAASADRRAALEEPGEPARLRSRETSRGCRRRSAPAIAAGSSSISISPRSGAAHPEGRSDAERQSVAGSRSPGRRSGRRTPTTRG